MDCNTCSLRTWLRAADLHAHIPEATAKCLPHATGAPWYVSSMQIHEDLGFPCMPTTSEPIASLDSKIADVENPLLWHLSRYFRCPRSDPGT